MGRAGHTARNEGREYIFVLIVAWQGISCVVIAQSCAMGLNGWELLLLQNHSPHLGFRPGIHINLQFLYAASTFYGTDFIFSRILNCFSTVEIVATKTPFTIPSLKRYANDNNPNANFGDANRWSCGIANLEYEHLLLYEWNVMAEYNSSSIVAACYRYVDRHA